MTLLLVDDEPMILELLKERVGKVLPKAALYDFSNAKKAIEFAGTTPIDIAFLDINMRILDGIEMAKRLQEIYPNINIIFCTGYTEYMQEAFDMYCSGYLVKPITEEKIKKAIEHLRYPVENTESKVTFRCFGNFEAYYGESPIAFRYSLTKMLLAYLVDRNGADCSVQEIMGILFEMEDRRSYFNHLRQDLIITFRDLGIENVLRVSKGKIGINRDMVKCDHFDYQDGKYSKEPTEYMTQYSFAETTYPKMFEL